MSEGTTRRRQLGLCRHGSTVEPITIREKGELVRLLPHIEFIRPYLRLAPVALAPHYRPPGIWAYPVQSESYPITLCPPPCHPLELIATYFGNWARDWKTLCLDRAQSWLTGTAILAEHLGLSAPACRLLYWMLTPVRTGPAPEHLVPQITRIRSALWSACGFEYDPYHVRGWWMGPERRYFWTKEVYGDVYL